MDTLSPRVSLAWSAPGCPHGSESLPRDTGYQSGAEQQHWVKASPNNNPSAFINHAVWEVLG